LIPKSVLPQWQEQHKDSIQGLFKSIYEYFTDDLCIGGVLSDFYMDFDCEENPDKSRKEAVVVVKKFISDYEIPQECIGIAFSGMKGFSITIDYRIFGAEASSFLPLIWKGIVQQLVSQLGLKTADTAIYERRRLWRLINSKHQKSGLYKIPLTIAELENLNISKIREIAKEPRPLFVKSDGYVVDKAVKLFQEHRATVESWVGERKRSF